MWNDLSTWDLLPWDSERNATRLESTSANNPSKQSQSHPMKSWLKRRVLFHMIFNDPYSSGKHLLVGLLFEVKNMVFFHQLWPCIFRTGTPCKNTFWNSLAMMIQHLHLVDTFSQVAVRSLLPKSKHHHTPKRKTWWDLPRCRFHIDRAAKNAFYPSLPCDRLVQPHRLPLLIVPQRAHETSSQKGDSSRDLFITYQWRSRFTP